MKFRSIFFGLAFCFTSLSTAQIQFTNNSELLDNNLLVGGFAMGVADMNGDALDDIIRFHQAEMLEIEFQQEDGTFVRENIGAITNDAAWSVAVADVDRNGNNDLITGGFYEMPTLLKSLGNNMYSTENLDGPLIFMQGSNFVDINADGNIDYFACHDDGISSPYKGDANGGLFFDENFFDSSSSLASDNSGNYSTTWIDYDNDGDLDCYLSKCRIGVGDPCDPRRLNLMFKNEGFGVYFEVAEQIGLQPKAQSWATEFGDIDNDGDLDVMMVNHDKNSMLYENDGTGNFTDISASAGFDLSLSTFPQAMQTYMQDFDNDGFLDIMVTSYSTFPKLFMNNGDKTFTEISNPWGTDINTDTNNNLQSAAMGDLNNDGFIDMIVGFANGINIPNLTLPDRLYLNTTNNGNNSIQIALNGTIGNQNGIGSRIELDGPWGTQIREVRSGHSYGVMNSLHAHFGIGTETEIDELRVYWPSGVISTLNDVNINECTIINESGINLSYETAEICEGDSLFLEGAYQTMAGTFTDTLSATSVLVTTLVVNQNYENTLPEVTTCFNSVVLVGDELIDTPGTHVFDYTSVDGCDSTVTVNVNWHDEILIDATIIDDWGPGTGSIEIDISGGAPPYQVFWITGDVDTLAIYDLAYGNTYQVEVVDSNGCNQVAEFMINLSSLSELQESGLNVFPNPFNNQFIIENSTSVTRTVDVYNTIGQKIISQTLSPGKTHIHLDEHPSGLYVLSVLDNKKKRIGSMQVVKR